MTEETKEEPKQEKRAWGTVHVNEQNKRRRSEDPPVSKVIKNLWKAHLADNKRSHVSLKQFARSRNDATAKEWFAHKRGSLDKIAKKQRLDLRGGTIRATALASKSARKKVKAGGKPAAT